MFGDLTKMLGKEIEKQATKAIGQALGGGGGGGEGASVQDAPPAVPLKSDCSGPEAWGGRVLYGGRKKAVFIGINYHGSKAELRGCINDVKNVQAFLTQHYGFTPDASRVLTDEAGAGTTPPTKQNILEALRWLVADARPGDSLFLHYSGHGGTQKDEDKDEADGFDETILPLDFERTGQIVDDELHSLVVQPLPEGVRLTAVFDSCHSGSVLDLPWSYKVDGNLEIVQIDNKKAALEAALKAGMAYASGRKREAMSHAMEGVQALMKPGGDNEARKKAEREKTTDADIIMFSGCRDSQTSADAQIEGRPTGAASYALLRCLGKDPHQTYTSLLKGMRTELEGKYTQVPCLSTAHVMDLNVPFSA